MSAERFETAKREAATKYAKTAGLPGHRERYMDSTASLRRLAPAIREQQKGETVMAKKKLPEAEEHFAQALKLAPDDYAGNVIMAKCLIAQRQPERANDYLSRARSVYPQEAQAMQLSALAKLALKQPEPAYAELVAYDKALPGNPNVAFMKGVCLENMQRREAAAWEYARYLRAVGQGQQAQYAAQRLRSWGYLR
jgi:thioredoxin-like negative regulator of GroEL